MTLTASCHSGATLDLLLILESRRESAMVSIDILVTTLFPNVTPRSYKSWIAHLDVERKHKKYYSAPRRDKRELIERAIMVLEMCISEGLLPKTRRELYADGYRVTKYKRDVLKEAVKKVKVEDDV